MVRYLKKAEKDEKSRKDREKAEEMAALFIIVEV